MSGKQKETCSGSPQCPEPDESEEPTGTNMETGEVNVKTEPLVITKEMEAEEQQLKEEGERKEKEMMEEARLSRERDSNEMRFKRLQHLLQKSPADQDGAAAERGASAATIYKCVCVSVCVCVCVCVCGWQDDTAEQKSLDTEDLENMSESNESIKSRLSATVRDKAKRLLDPSRKVNGEPVPFQQPALFTGGVMRWYQIEGIEWLRMLWENGINGILADEMGLGKTIQCIAHIAMMIEKKVLGPFLVVAPLSTLPNWISEFKRFTPQVSVVLYHGPQAERAKRLKQIRRPHEPLGMCPVVVTSFEIAMIDRKYLQRFQWKYLIVDEGHRIKNLNCRLVRELKMMPTDNKLLLTGTPLQNNLAELWSLLNFLLPEVFDDLKSFESWFDVDSLGVAESLVASEREHNILSMLHQILTPFLLRRLKSDVTLEVPPKKEIVVYAPLTPKQELLYTAIVNNTIAKMLGREKTEAPVELNSDGRPKRRSRRTVDYSEMDEDLDKYLEKLQKEQDLAASSSSVVDVHSPLDAEINLKLRNILMLLKKCCNHPYLLEYPLDPTTQEFKIDEQLVRTSGKFLILDRLLPALKKRGHKVLIFSQMTSILDLLVDYCYLRDFEYSRLDGSMTYADREDNINKFFKDPEVFVFLLSTRAGGLGINLTAADTVIIFDSDWNPQADIQAQDRCHRIGQTKPVVVYRFVTANTIDQKIYERASAKRKLEQMVIHKNKFKGAKTELSQGKSCIDLDELMELLKGRSDEKQVKTSRGKVLSDKDLEVLLDRSDLLDV
uniref:Proliferation-associated SNF2-like protein n=1 Tax=Periophthalmus magnuspinnatus TaxID=409849 RepID=A0A3B4AMZ6_9GOBI